MSPSNWLLSFVTAIIVGLLANWLFSNMQGTVLDTSDFQVQLAVSAHGTALNAGYKPPDVIDLLTSIGPIIIKSKLKIDPAGAREHFPQKNSVSFWKYTDKHPIIKGLSTDITFKSLSGQIIKMRLPIRAFKFKNYEVARFQFQLFIKGREISARPDEEGTIELLITNRLLGTNGGNMVEILTIIAIILGPIFAVQIERFLARRRDEKERRLRVFKTLMVTRGAVLSPAHVEALNSIDIEFNSNDQKDERVRNSWKAYLDQLAHYPKDKATEDDQKRWKERTDELLVELLYEMSKALGYTFDKTHIKRTAYTPVRYSDVEFEHDIIRRSLVKLFLGNGSIPIEIRSPTTQGDQPTSEEHLRRLLIEHYEGNKPIKVVIEDDKRQG